MRLILPKFAFVCGVKLKPFEGSHASTVPPAPLGVLGTMTLQVVSKDTLATVYDKVWTRVGRKGGLVYLPAAGASANAHQSQ